MPFLIVLLYIFLTCAATFLMFGIVCMLLGAFLEIYDRYKNKKTWGKK